MAHHLMAVCVVCLLCAEHLPCKEHFEKINDSNSILKISDKISNDNYNIKSNIIRDKRKTNYKTDIELPIIEYIETLKRIRRHSTHQHNHNNNNDHNHNHNKEIPEISKYFVTKIFERFGDSDKKMNIEGFEMMLDFLSLYSFQVKDHSYNSNDKNNTDNNTCLSSIDLLHRTSEDEKFDTTKLFLNDINNTKITNLTKSNNNSQEQNTNTKLNVFKKNTYLLDDDIVAVCPILLYHMAAKTSLERSGCIQNNLLPTVVHHHNHHIEIVKEDKKLIWIYASLSIFGVSLCGLLGVAVIPFMEKRFYNQLLQFLVALAVGTLAGDALLHLLPHAMIGEDASESTHQSMIWKGLIAVLGIIFFFFTERAFTMIAEKRKEKQKKEKPSSCVRVMRDPDSIAAAKNTNVEKLCKNRYNSYLYCYDEIAMETKDDHHHHHNIQNNDKIPSASEAYHKNLNNSIIPYCNHDHGDNNDTIQSLLPINCDTTDKFININDTDKDDGHNTDNNTISTNLDDGSIERTKNTNMVSDKKLTVILREHESKHHGHSHTHGHVHSPPSSLSSVAWMVIMGDGLHNFTDGMTIGAAFSNNIAGGFSTAIAVFCHELPHELGDFAVLLKAGMSARQAVSYNLLSSVLSFLGMILGIIIGDHPESSSYVFACAAGLFIYIALVDMIPEITSFHKDRSAISKCILQFVGMITGLGIMLLIALYEDDLKQIFTR